MSRSRRHFITLRKYLIARRFGLFLSFEFDRLSTVSFFCSNSAPLCGMLFIGYFFMDFIGYFFMDFILILR
jgi:hypothetical protein